MKLNKLKNGLGIIVLICSICILIYPLFKSNTKHSIKVDNSIAVSMLLDRDGLYNRLATNKDIVYKTVGENELTLDIIMPEKSPYEKIPVVIFVHGGSWINGDKSQVFSKTKGDTTMKLLDEGYAVVSIEYSLLDGEVVFPQNIIDVKDSIRWIRKNADEYNLDAGNIGIWGTSAGAHLSLMSAYTEDNDFLGDEELRDYSSKVNYVININAPIDIVGLLEITSEKESKGFANKLFGVDLNSQNLDKEIDKIKSYFPIEYINKDSVDTLIFHGTEDSIVPISQSEYLYNELLKFDVGTKFIIIDGAKHGLVPISDKDLEMVSKETVDFIKSHYVQNK